MSKKGGEENDSLSNVELLKTVTSIAIARDRENNRKWLGGIVFSLAIWGSFVATVVLVPNHSAWFYGALFVLSGAFTWSIFSFTNTSQKVNENVVNKVKKEKEKLGKDEGETSDWVN